jgi:hypothetical protein
MAEKSERLETGIYGLDQIIEGGFRDKSSIVCVGHQLCVWDPVEQERQLSECSF